MISMDKIHIYTEKGRNYFIEKGTNQFYITFETTKENKEKISRYSFLAVISVPLARGLSSLLDRWYIPISNVGSNLFLIFILIGISYFIYLKCRNNVKRFNKEQEPFSVILDEWQKEELIKKSLSASRFSLVLIGVLFFMTAIFGIIFLLSSELIFYILTAVTIIMFAALFSYAYILFIRLKLLKETLKIL